MCPSLVCPPSAPSCDLRHDDVLDGALFARGAVQELGLLHGRLLASHLHPIQRIASGLALSGIGVTDGVVAGAAALVVIAACGLGVGAARVHEAVAADLKLAAAGLVLLALEGAHLVAVLGAGGLGGRGGRGARGGGGRVRVGLDREGSHGADTALPRTAILAKRQTNVSLLAPPVTPRVLHDPVALARVIAHSQHAVVELSAAGRVQDAASVKLKRTLIGLDGDAHRLLCHRLHESALAVCRNILEAVDADDVAILFSPVAAASSGMVRVVRLSVETAVTDNVLERIVHEAALAAVVTGVAVHELLLAQGDHLTSHDLVSTLDGPGSREGPARTALSLVLHLAHCP
mmetsp:Transcript_32513/g.58208  ORF Transcript_32513/g.58208 Transcript_32513/m.58208 type:complete len:347 (+) Transcript_32513:127-1167(+)